MFSGIRLRGLREGRGLSQRALGELIGAPQNSIYRYEAGLVKNVPAEILIKLAKALQCSVDYLLGLSPIPETSTEELSPNERELIAQFRASRSRNPQEFAALMALKRPRQKRKPG